MEQENKISEVVVGSLYDLNKDLVQKNEIKLSEGIINSKKEIIKNFLRKTNHLYYMLLCNERKDYTIFRLSGTTVSEENIEKETVNILIDECLPNRGGEIRAIDLTKEQDAIEIWLSIDGESYVYYFFPYDDAIIEV